MPWEIKEGTSQCSGYGVFKEGTSELAGCHTTRAAAQRQVAALYASETKELNTMKNDINKSVRVGAMVSWNSSGGRAKGKVKRIIRNGSYNVPDSDFTITGTPDNPAVVIELYRDGKPTGRMVGHRMSTLRVTKSVWSSFNPRSVERKSNEVIFSKRNWK
jgi:hypothetical protein